MVFMPPFKHLRLHIVYNTATSQPKDHLMPKITLIAACAPDRCIGINNTMPWHLPEDFAFFKSYTLDKPVMMGRKTWESLPRKPLPGRRNIVISRQADYPAEGAETVGSLEEALALCAASEEVIIMGGAQIYAQALPLASDLRITEVALNVQGDAFFPEFSPSEWHEAARETHTSANGTGYAFVHYTRIR